MKTKNRIRGALTFGFILLLALNNSAFAQQGRNTMASPVKQDATKLRSQMHKLWEDHIIWTRNVILCLVDELPGRDQAVKRLLRNEEDLGLAFKQYYGEAMGKQMTALLTAHILLFPEVVTAEKSGNVIQLDKASKKWRANAEEIAVLLCKMNPAWDLAEMKLMWYGHLNITSDEAMQRIKKDYTADVIAFDKIHHEILIMADLFSGGIIAQFPEKFEEEGGVLIAK